MPLPGFYDDNEGRYYPLVPFSNVPLGTAPPAIPPLDALIDFGCLVGLDAEFDSSKNIVYLYQITRTGNTFMFDFRSDAPGLVGHALMFSRTVTDAEYTTDYAEAAPIDPDEGLQAPLWEGFLVTGPLGDLAALMPTDGTVVTPTSPQIEPALVQNLGHSYLRTINLANQDRTKVAPAPDCPGYDDSPVTAAPYIVNATGLVGNIRFEEGYNISIRQSARNNSLTFSASQGAGLGSPCEEVPLYQGESSPDGGSLLTGGPTCDELVSSINGLTASIIRLVPDLGVSIVPADIPNTLIVNFDLNDMTVCGPTTVIVEELDDA
jgi:hypothetical protein